MMRLLSPVRGVGTRQGVLILLLLALLPCTAGADSGKLAERKVLPNGLVLLHSEKTTLPIVKINMGLYAGQTEETRDMAGLSNLTASLLKEGTLTRSADEINESIEFVGGSLSATGGGDYATLSLSVLKKDLDLGFELLSDILLNPSFPDEAIARLKAETKSRMARENEEPDSIASKAFARELYGQHPFSWPPEGTEESVDRITREDIVSFHSRCYRPNRAWMAVVGDVSLEETVGLIDRFMAGWQPGEPRQEDASPLPVLTEPRLVLLDKKITQANVILGHPGISRTDPDYYPVLVMNYILGGGGFASRLMDTIRDDMGLVYGIYSAFVPHRSTGAFEVTFETKNESAGTAVNQVLKQMKRIRSEEVSEAELADAKAYLTGSLPLRMDSNGKMAGLLLSVEYFGLGMNYVDDYINAVNAVSAADVLRAAKEHLDPEHYLLVVVGDQDQIGMKQTP